MVGLGSEAWGSEFGDVNWDRTACWALGWGGGGLREEPCICGATDICIDTCQDCIFQDCIFRAACYKHEI